MELNLEEQRLLAEFRALPAEGRKELLDYVAFLAKKQSLPQYDEEAKNQCSLKQQEKRPETAAEPLFTE